MIVRTLSSLPQPAQRIIALGLAALVVLILWFAAIAPGFTLVRSQANWRIDAQRVIAEGKGAEAVIPTLEGLLQSLPEAPEWHRLYEAPEEGQIQQQLESDVRTLLGQAGVRDLVIALRPAASDGRLRVLSVEVTFTADAQQLHAALSGLRGSGRYLRVSRIAATSPALQAPESNADIRVSLVVSGYADPEKEPPRENGVSG